MLQVLRFALLIAIAVALLLVFLLAVLLALLMVFALLLARLLPQGLSGLTCKMVENSSKIALIWVNYSIHGPPQLKFPQFGSQPPRGPKHRIPRVRFMKIRPGGRSGDLNRTDLRPYLGLAHLCSSLPRKEVREGWGEEEGRVARQLHQLLLPAGAAAIAGPAQLVEAFKQPSIAPFPAGALVILDIRCF